ncbi:MAG TPA: hypothetical protein VMK53_06590 [Gemmatimonadales bacterium]|nr:hypothetical protein [Gemmatimonadales bacterium]
MSTDLRSRPVRILAIVLVVLVALEATVAPHSVPKFPWHYIPGYAGIIGLGVGLLVIWLATALGRAGLQRPERGDD